MKVESFEESGLIGQNAVDFVCSYLKLKNIDYRLITQKEEQIKGDLFFRGKYVEVKHMLYKDSFCIEETGACGGKGWIYTCQADYILYVNLMTGKLYYIKIDDLKDYYHKVKLNYTLIDNTKRTNGYFESWVSQYRVFPVYSISNYCKVKEINVL